MRSRAWLRVVLGALAASAAGANARDDGVGTLRLWELPGYTLIAADRYDPRVIVRRFDDTQRALSKLLATPVKPTRVPTIVWLVPHDAWNRYLAPSRDIVGEFVPRRFANYLLINADIGADRLRKGVQHEYTHLFLRTQWGGLYPLWFDEGLAEILGAASLGHRRATFPPPFAPSVAHWIPMSRLFEIDKSSPEYLNAPQTDAVHRESWGIVHRGLLANPEFGDKVFAYIAAINRLVPADDAVRESFGTSFDALDDDMQGYLMQRTYAVAKLRFAGAPRPRLPVGRALSTGEALEMLARVALDTGFAHDNVAELVEAADRASPGSRAVAVLNLRLAVRDRRDAEALRLAAAIDSLDDFATLRDTGLALFERVREPAAGDPLSDGMRMDFEQAAFARLDRALRIDAGDAPAAWAYALLATRLHAGVDTALERLASARTRMPGHPDLAEATALALEARGQESAMMPYLLDTLRNTGSAEQRARAARRIAELRISERLKAPQ